MRLDKKRKTIRKKNNNQRLLVALLLATGAAGLVFLVLYLVKPSSPEDPISRQLVQEEAVEETDFDGEVPVLRQENLVKPSTPQDTTSRQLVQKEAIEKTDINGEVPVLIQKGDIEVMPFVGKNFTDNTGKNCAVIDVYAGNIIDLYIEGSLIVQGPTKQNGKWRIFCYVPEGVAERNIKIIAEGFSPFNLKISPGFLKPGFLHSLELEVKLPKNLNLFGTDSNGMYYNFKNDEPTEEEMEDFAWVNRESIQTYVNNHSQGFNISDENKKKDMCLVYLLLNSKSLDSKEDKQNWFDLYPVMNDEQIKRLYEILFKEKVKLLYIEIKYHYENECQEGRFKEGVKCYDNGDYTKAVEYFTKSAQREYPSAYNRLAYMAAEGKGMSQSYNKAHAYIDEAIKIAPQNWNYYDSKGEIYLMQGNTIKAKEYYHKCFTLYSDYGSIKESVLREYFDKHKD